MIAWPRIIVNVALFTGLVASPAAHAQWVWIEGERPARSTMNRHPWWYDKVNRDQLSGGDFISNFNKDKSGEAHYRFVAPRAGEYEFWVRANPVAAKLSYQLNGGEWKAIDLKGEQRGSMNIAEDGKIDLRFIAWMRAGKVVLKQGENAIAFRMHSENSNHGALDCFVFSAEAFRPQGTLKPDQLADFARKIAAENAGWIAFDPKPEAFGPTSGFDLRGLNEKRAGDGGYIAANDGRFVHSATSAPVRFWAVNGPPSTLKDRDSLRQHARLLAKYGVNLVRIHGGYFDGNGNVDLAKVRHTIDIIEAMKEEGIYSHLSIYFPLWLRPKPGTPWLDGYDGAKHPFAAIYFNADFQKRYREWWTALLTTPSEKTGKRLIDEPAVFGVEMVNEDSYFFWTFDAKNIPDPQLRILEVQFGAWLKGKYGSIDAALQKWGGRKHPRDNPAEGRVAFRSIWEMFNQKTARDKDTVRFLLEGQRGFYEQTYKFLRQTGFKGMITASNWTTASAEIFGPLEAYSYTVGDFIDRHGYFGCNGKGDNAAWSVRDGHTYADRSALRFEAENPGKPRLFVHPAMDIHYNDKPSMISETTFCRPNRYRSEAPLFYAAYGALQDSDAIVHFALDGSNWAVKPGFFMQPWTLMSPAMVGQFPAAALIYRKSLVSAGDQVVDLNLKLDDLLDLRGTPLPQGAALDELRLKDVPLGMAVKPGDVINPLVHMVGRTRVAFSQTGGPAKIADLSKFIDRAKQTVTSTTGQVRLDYGQGVLTINAPAAQGVCGALDKAGAVDLKDLAITSDLDLGQIIAVSLDDRPLASSARILLQVMTEEKTTGFQTSPVSEKSKRIDSIGHDPWLMKEPRGTVRFKRSDAASLKVTALDQSGYPAKPAGTANQIKLEGGTMYYLIAP